MMGGGSESGYDDEQYIGKGREGLEYRKLGNTGIEVSEIGFGAWAIGGDAWGPVEDQASLQGSYLPGIGYAPGSRYLGGTAES